MQNQDEIQMECRYLIYYRLLLCCQVVVNYFKMIVGECIQDTWICDGTEDCQTGEDEQHCNATHRRCNDKQFLCRLSGLCIPIAQVCDGVVQCPDNSDETNCLPPTSKFPIFPYLFSFLSLSLSRSTYISPITFNKVL